MIPRANITAWRNQAPWSDDGLVEQDLVLSRALVEIFSHPVVASDLAFRGGTALHKLIFEAPLRYSEDIDLVQVQAGPIRGVMQAIHEQLDGWLGQPSTRQGATGVKMIYVFESESEPRSRRKLKIEIHTREHFSVLGLEGLPFTVSNPWYTGDVRVPTYKPEELLGTKLRALYQRKKGRDLFDLFQALTQLDLSHDQVIECFLRYTEAKPVSRAEFEANLAAKAGDLSFTEDTRPLLTPGTTWESDEAYRLVSDQLIARIPGAPWKGA